MQLQCIQHQHTICKWPYCYVDTFLCHPATPNLIVRKGNRTVLTYINTLVWHAGLEASTLHRARWKHTTGYSSYYYVQLNSNKWKEKLMKWSIPHCPVLLLEELLLFILVVPLLCFLNMFYKLCVCSCQDHK